MSTPLLKTKLYIPPVRPELMARPRLIERLNAGLHRKLTLVSAPAGFGKTTLLSEWVAGGERPVAWLSLDEGDSDPAHFLVYFVAALRTTEADIAKGVLSALQSPQPPPIEVVLTFLINELAGIPDPLIFVLDDYYLMGSSPVDEALAFVLERLPPQVHLVIATRDDPQLPLARLRARGQLTELRATDLRFSSSEAAEFLNQAMGLDLSAEDIAALERRTEGWIAGLQLAAISMQGRRDVSSFIQSFTGSHRFVLDYLVEEVLEQQSQSVQTFLFQTAVLDRLTGSLCDTLTGQDNGQATLEMLERANLFIVPLDSEEMPDRWLFIPIDEGGIKVITLVMLFESIQPPGMPVPLSGPAAVDMWLAAEGGDASGMALASLSRNMFLPNLWTWGEGLSLAASVDDYHDPARDYGSEFRAPNAILGTPFSLVLWSMGLEWPTHPIPQEHLQVQPTDVETLLISGSVDFSTPPQFATEELLPYLSNGEQVILKDFGHTSTFWNSQPQARVHMLNTFFDTGQVDASLYAYQPLDFDAGLGWPGLAKLLVAVVVLVPILLLVLVWLIVR